MTEYPTRWDVVELGSCLNRIDAGNSPDLPDRPAGPGEWGVLKVSAIRPAGFDAVENKAVTNSAFVDPRAEVRDGDLLITRANTPQLVGLACYVESPPERLLLCDKTLRLVVDERLLIGKFAGYVLAAASVRKQIEASGTGSSGSMKNISQADIRSLRFPLPSVCEQKRIIEFIDAADESIRSQELLIAKLEAAKDGAIAQLMTHGTACADGDGACRLSQASRGHVRSDWRVGSVGQFGEVRLGRQRSPQHEIGAFMKPYLRVANVFDGYIDTSDVLEMNFSISEQEVYSVRSGDLLLNEGQSLDLVGRCAKYDGPDGMYCFQNTLIRYRCSDLLEPDFAYYVFSWWLKTRRFADVAKQTTSIAHLGADRFAKMEMAVPNVAEQRRICSILMSYVERVRAARVELAKLRRVKFGMVDDLLSGRTDVGRV